MAKKTCDFVVWGRFGGDDFVDVLELVHVVAGVGGRDAVGDCDAEDFVAAFWNGLSWSREDGFWDGGVDRSIEVVGRKAVEGGEKGNVSFHIRSDFRFGSQGRKRWIYVDTIESERCSENNDIEIGCGSRGLCLGNVAGSGVNSPPPFLTGSNTRDTGIETYIRL